MAKKKLTNSCMMPSKIQKIKKAKDEVSELIFLHDFGLIIVKSERFKRQAVELNNVAALSYISNVTHCKNIDRSRTPKCITAERKNKKVHSLTAYLQATC